MLELKRLYIEHMTIGVFQSKGKFISYSFELPYRSNKRKISCINEGTYQIKIENHKKYNMCIRLYNVHNRDRILIHAANFYNQLLGCIAPVMSINNVGGLESRKALDLVINEIVIHEYETITILSKQ